jgi:hypothetical protein
MKPKTYKLGSPEGNRALRAWENRRLDPDPQPRRRNWRRAADYDDYDREATDAEYDKIMDDYERRIYGE